MDIVERLKRITPQLDLVLCEVVCQGVDEITKLRAELRLAQDIIGDLQRHEPVCLGESRNARPR